MAAISLPVVDDRAPSPSRATGRAAAIAALESLNFSTQPALAAALPLAAGVALAHLHWIAPAWLLAIGILPLSLLCWVSRGQTRIVLVPLVALWVVLGAFLIEVQPQADPQKQLIHFADGEMHQLSGEVVRFGATRTLVSRRPFSNEAFQERQLSIQLAVRDVDGHPVTGGARIAIYAPMEVIIAPPGCGDLMTVNAKLKQPQVYRDPGVWDARAWLLGQGVSVLAAADAMQTATPTHDKRGPLACWVHALQTRASQSIVALGTGTRPQWMPKALTLSADDASMVTAMVTGDRSYLERGERRGFERTGAFHILVVSGLHVGLIAALLLAITRKLQLSRGLSALVTGTLAIAYAIFTGFGAPVQRALAMVLLYLAARALYRARDALHAAAVAALCLLAWNPSALFDAGFQMTVLTVVATGGLVAPLLERSIGPYIAATRRIPLAAADQGMPPRLAQFRIMLRLLAEKLAPFIPALPIPARSLPMKRRMVLTATILAFATRLVLRATELTIVSATVEVVMALPMALYFHRITVLALPVNLLLIPALGVLLPAAILAALVALVSPHAALLPGAILAFLLHAAAGIVHFFSRIDFGNLRVAAPTPISIATFTLTAAFATWALRRRRFFAVVFTSCFAMAVAAVVLPHAVQARPNVLEISALDVGQGDALLVVTPQGKTLMVDCGGPTGGDMTQHGNFEIGEDVVSPVLWSRGIQRLDAVVLTHAHSDHMGGMFAVLENFHPRELWVGNNPPTSEYQALLAEAGHFHIQVHRFHTNEHFSYGGMSVRVLAPSADYQPAPTARNDDSLVLLLANRATSALLEGDAESPSEGRMALLPSIHADLLKVAHHGSKTSSTADFLRAVSPRYAVISVGLQNLYRHPRFETLEHLQASGIRTYRTDLNGMTTFYLDGKNILSDP